MPSALTAVTPWPSSAFPRTAKTILVGDSVTAEGLNRVQIPTTAGLIVKNGIATVNTSGQGNHLLVPGSKALIANAGDPTLSDPLNCAFITVLQVFNNTLFTCSATYANQTQADADLSNKYTGSNPWYVSSMHQGQDSAYWQWLNAFSRGQFQIVANFSFWGMTTACLAPLLARIAAGPSYDIVMEMSGINDINAATTVAGAISAAQTAASNRIAFANTQIAQGKTVILCSSNCIGTTSNQSVKNIGLLQLRFLLMRYAQANFPFVRFLDIFRDVVDGTSNVGAFASGYVGAQILHISSAGCIDAARIEAANLAPFFPPLDTQPVSILEDNTTFAQATAPYPNLVPHGGMDGTSGTVNSPVTGTMPTGWTIGAATGTIAAAGGATRVKVTGTNSQNWGFGMTVNASSLTVGQGYLISSPSFPTTFVSGNWYQCGISLRALADFTNIQYIQTVLLLRGILLQDVTLFGPGNDNTVWTLKSGDTANMVSPPFIAGPAINTALFQITLLAQGTGSANVEFSSAFCRQIDNPYQ